MGIQASRYNIFGVEDFRISPQNIFDGYGVDVVYQDSVAQFELGVRKIASVVSNDNLVSEVKPLSGMVEYLIQISIMTERVCTDTTSNLKIPISFNERRYGNQLGVAFNTHRDHHY